MAAALLPIALRMRRGERARIGEESMEFAGERMSFPNARPASKAAVVAVVAVALLTAGCATVSGKATTDDSAIP